MKHIGIVACSAEGAALCYTTICVEGERYTGVRYRHPEVSMYTLPFSDYVEAIEAGNWEKVAKLMLDSAKKLAKIGADFAICPDNTIHVVFDDVVKESPIPWLHIAEEVSKVAEEKGYKKVLITGTKYLMESNVYPEKLEKSGIEWAIPEEGDREEINRIIFEELLYGVFKDESRKFFYSVFEKAREDGCEAVILGCTEIPLLVGDDSPLPTLDSTRILARAALKEAVFKTGMQVR